MHPERQYQLETDLVPENQYHLQNIFDAFTLSNIYLPKGLFNAILGDARKYVTYNTLNQSKGPEELKKVAIYKIGKIFPDQSLDVKLLPSKFIFVLSMYCGLNYTRYNGCIYNNPYTLIEKIRKDAKLNKNYVDGLITSVSILLKRFENGEDRNLIATESPDPKLFIFSDRKRAINSMVQSISKNPDEVPHVSDPNPFREYFGVTTEILEDEYRKILGVSPKELIEMSIAEYQNVDYISRERYRNAQTFEEIIEIQAIRIKQLGDKYIPVNLINGENQYGIYRKYFGIFPHEIARICIANNWGSEVTPSYILSEDSPL
ncbi:hypothetical protein KW795_03075, partial [Candidatus Microgenomates bacterium]|nr:hypothetical protein [Candidatus Microgenomates bacterium]